MSKSAKKKVVKNRKALSRGQKVLYARKSRDIPVSTAMLDEVRAELKHDITSVRLEVVAVSNQLKSLEKRIDGRFEKIDEKFMQIDSRFEQIDSRFEQIDSRFEQIDSRFIQVDLRFKEMDAKIDAKFAQMDSKFNVLLSEIHRIGLLVEEQNARNKYVLDGYASLSDRLDKVEFKLFKEST